MPSDCWVHNSSLDATRHPIFVDFTFARQHETQGWLSDFSKMSVQVKLSVSFFTLFSSSLLLYAWPLVMDLIPRLIAVAFMSACKLQVAEVMAAARV